MNDTQSYPPLEEKLNVISHALGFIFSIIALIFLVIKASIYGNSSHIVSFAVFGICMATLYAASTSYHYAKNIILRQRLKIFDHAAIFLLIAGTQTPYALVTLKDHNGWLMMAIAWGLASIGIILKLFFTGKFKILSTSMYVFMGWIMFFASESLINNLHELGLYWLIAGGIAYTIGAVMYILKRVNLNHAIFHMFVLAGSICHFISIYFYVLKVE